MISIQRATGAHLLEVKAHCEAFHYLGRYPDPRSLPFAYLLVNNGTLHAPDGRLWGLTVFSKPQHHKHKGLFGYPDKPTAWQVLNLARVWIHGDLQQPGFNMFSQMVSRCIRRCQFDWLEHHPPPFPDLPYHIELVISYADLRYHTGTAYRASGFTLHGEKDGKALYYRRLKPPLKSWLSLNYRPVQLTLLPNTPLRYGR